MIMKINLKLYNKLKEFKFIKIESKITLFFIFSIIEIYICFKKSELILKIELMK